MSNQPLPSMLDDPNYVEPDSLDLAFASKIILSPCPFCGRQPLGSPSFNKVTGIHGYEIICCRTSPFCHVIAHYNGSTKADAIKGAVMIWETRNGVLNPDSKAVKFIQEYFEKGF
jgi:hypothetical protein